MDNTDRMRFKSIQDVERYANQLMTKEYKVEANGKVHTLTPSKLGYTFKFDSAKRRFGLCSYRRKEISLSKPLCEYNLDNFYQINDTMLHEIAHALSYKIHGRRGMGHCKRWVHVAKSIGCNGIRCYDSSQVNNIEHKYSLICDTCGGNYPRHRRPRQEYSCAKCEPKRFNSKYLLRVVQNF
jgi:predicted SprT family Zn-dependent metalloprotease